MDEYKYLVKNIVNEYHNMVEFIYDIYILGIAIHKTTIFNILGNILLGEEVE